MDWISTHIRILRLVTLALLVIGLLGPWVYEAIYMPDQYECTPPLVRIRPNICGDPMTGMFVIGYFSMGFFTALGGLLSGARAFQDAGRELLAALVWLPLLPLFSSLLLVWRGQRLRGFHCAMLMLGLGVSAYFIVAEHPSVFSPQLWGPWLYLITLILGLSLEIGIMLKSRPRA
jgi:hypothetical protein